MKIISAEINWMQGFGNSPQPTLVVDELPRFDALAPIWHRTKEYVYANIGDVFSFIVYKPRSSDKNSFLGFGGAEYKRQLNDGTLLESNNWWSGGAYGLSYRTGTPFLDVGLRLAGENLTVSGFAIRAEDRERYFPGTRLIKKGEGMPMYSLGFGSGRVKPPRHIGLSIYTQRQPERV